MATISVLIPSLLKKYSTDTGERYFLQRAVESVSRQTLITSGAMRAQIIVGIDPGTVVPPDLPDEFDAEFVTSRGRWAAAALNAAAERIEGEYVAILEDDDQWEPQFLEISIPAAQSGAFVSSNQRVVDAFGAGRRIFDYPAPSGWVMKHEVWLSAGGFNEEYRWHHDAEWIGRLNARSHPRVHLVEATAPVPILPRGRLGRLLARWAAKGVRRSLMRVALSGPNVRIVPHSLGQPLVTRQSHQNSAHALLSREDSMRQQSEFEKRRLRQQYGKAIS